ncbi:unnamed protein product [Allacma fusca]|uniref:Uncharacterized protein n=1 Tax=Allacma fusca TaxID=39272 RepID=A0A8J2KDJ7_9HEXA|nr:unnamed protein product [Allacma fusca]
MKDQVLTVFFCYPNNAPRVVIKKLSEDIGFIVKDKRFAITHEFQHFDEPTEDDKQFIDDLLLDMNIRPINVENVLGPVRAKQIYYDPNQDPKLNMSAAVKLRKLKFRSN